MKISISRNGSEIGDWTRDEIIELYGKGQVLVTDLYWHEGMSEWQELRVLLKPPIPKAPSKSPQAVAIPPAQAQSRGPMLTPKYVSYKPQPVKIDRIAFLCWMLLWGVLSLAAGTLCNYLTGINPGSDDMQLGQILKFFLVILPSGAAFLFILAPRFRSMGYPGWYAWFCLIPVVGMLLVLACFFMPPKTRQSL